MTSGLTYYANISNSPNSCHYQAGVGRKESSGTGLCSFGLKKSPSGASKLHVDKKVRNSEFLNMFKAKI